VERELGRGAYEDELFFKLERHFGQMERMFSRGTEESKSRMDSEDRISMQQEVSIRPCGAQQRGVKLANATKRRPRRWRKQRQICTRGAHNKQRNRENRLMVRWAIPPALSITSGTDSQCGVG
jgi:hypothetical protein